MPALPFLLCVVTAAMSARWYDSDGDGETAAAEGVRKAATIGATVCGLWWVLMSSPTRRLARGVPVRRNTRGPPLPSLLLLLLLLLLALLLLCCRGAG